MANRRTNNVATNENARIQALSEATYFWKAVLDNADKFEVKDLDLNDDIVVKTAEKFLEFLTK